MRSLELPLSAMGAWIINNVSSSSSSSRFRNSNYKPTGVRDSIRLRQYREHSQFAHTAVQGSVQNRISLIQAVVLLSYAHPRLEEIYDNVFLISKYATFRQAFGTWDEVSSRGYRIDAPYLIFNLQVPLFK